MATTPNEMAERLRAVERGFAAPKRSWTGSSNRPELEAISATQVKKRTVSNEYTPLTPLAQTTKESNHILISKLWHQLSESNQYEELRRILDNQFGLQDPTAIKRFFSEKGLVLLMSGTVHVRAPEFLAFVCDYVPHNLIRETLRLKNYEVLASLLLSHTGLEKAGKIDAERLRERHEKLKLLVKVDPEGIDAYIDQDYFKNRFTEAVKTSVKEAVAGYKASQIALSKY